MKCLQREKPKNQMEKNSLRLVAPNDPQIKNSCNTNL